MGDLIRRKLPRLLRSVRRTVVRTAVLPPFRTAFFLTLLLFSAVAQPVSAEQEHPFLIVKKSMYPELRKRAEKEPWADIKRSAVGWFNSGYNPRSGKETRDLSVFLSRAALVYILTESETVRQGAVNAMVGAITRTVPQITRSAQARNHGRTVPPGTAFFIAVLAVDIIHDDMSSSQKTSVENALRPLANFFINAPSNWPLNVYGARLVWHLYKGNTAAADTAIASYIQHLNRQVTADGVFKAGPEYAAVRAAQGRYAKTHAMDVLAFTGKRDLYKEPRLISLYEWMYGYSLTPFGTFYSFGDSNPDDYDNLGKSEVYSSWQSRALSAHKFSTTAGLNAAYAMRGISLANVDLSLLAYIFYDRESPLVSRPPPSRIFPDGGAYFRERTESVEALGGAMHNFKTPYADHIETHVHKDTNAIHIAAYGENVLRNSGYAGWGSGTSLKCPTCTWAYINRTAKSSNVVTVDEVDYTAKPGGGITEGFTGDSFDYASGRSGPGFSNGTHDRNFCFVHPSTGANGYFVLFDEVFSSGGSDADLYLHPNSDDTKTEATRERYRWPVGSSTNSNISRTDNEVSVTVFLATPPDTATIEDGVLAGKYSFVGEYLHATYEIEEKNARFATVIFPHDKSRSRPDMIRIGVADLYTGARIDHSEEVADFVVQPVAGKADETISDIDGKGVSVRGAAAWFRMRGDSVESFFLRKGKLFETGGFKLETEDSVSMLLEGTRGRIIAGGETGTNLVVRWTSASWLDVHLNGSAVPLPVINSGKSWIKVAIPAGNHEFEIKTRGLMNSSTRISLGPAVLFRHDTSISASAAAAATGRYEYTFFDSRRTGLLDNTGVLLSSASGASRGYIAMLRVRRALSGGVWKWRIILRLKNSAGLTSGFGGTEAGPEFSDAYERSLRLVFRNVPSDGSSPTAVAVALGDSTEPYSWEVTDSSFSEFFRGFRTGMLQFAIMDSAIPLGPAVLFRRDTGISASAAAAATGRYEYTFFDSRRTGLLDNTGVLLSSASGASRGYIAMLRVRRALSGGVWKWRIILRLKNSAGLTSGFGGTEAGPEFSDAYEGSLRLVFRNVPSDGSSPTAVAVALGDSTEPYSWEVTDSSFSEFFRGFRTGTLQFAIVDSARAETFPVLFRHDTGISASAAAAATGRYEYTFFDSRRTGLLDNTGVLLSSASGASRGYIAMLRVRRALSGGVWKWRIILRLKNSAGLTSGFGGTEAGPEFSDAYEGSLRLVFRNVPSDGSSPTAVAVALGDSTEPYSWEVTDSSFSEFFRGFRTGTLQFAIVDSTRAETSVGFLRAL